MATFEGEKHNAEYTKSNLPADLAAARAELERLLTENNWLEPDRGDLSKYEMHVWRTGWYLHQLVITLDDDEFVAPNSNAGIDNVLATLQALLRRCKQARALASAALSRRLRAVSLSECTLQPQQHRVCTALCTCCSNARLQDACCSTPLSLSAQVIIIKASCASTTNTYAIPCTLCCCNNVATCSTEQASQTTRWQTMHTL
jgi:hypothetical protein